MNEVAELELPTQENFRIDLRTLPTVKDRVAQMAMKLVIEPIFEAGFKASSFGFRPRRSALQWTRGVTPRRSRVRRRAG